MRVPVLDGFRATAILMVMACHLFGYSMLGRQWSMVPKIIAAVTAPGWLGVDLFFVLSGLLITTILMRTRDDVHYLKHFYTRRLRRIFPLYLAMLFLMVVFFGAGWKFFLICILFGANLLSIFGVTGPAPASVFWSLAVEEHFYFLWPMTVRYLSRRTLALVCVALILVEPALRCVCSGLGIYTYEYSWFRVDGLAMGALLALYLGSGGASRRVSKRLIVAGAGVFIAGAIFLVAAHAITNASNNPAGTLRSSVATFGFAAVMLAALEFPSWWVAPLCSGFARLTARFSYCLYLVHISISSLYDRFLAHDTFEGVLARAAVVAALSYAVAALSYKFLEQPLLRKNNRSLAVGAPALSAPSTAA
jgi:peptidoglycan/LPS O-acetylase OafA/YrhL